MWSIVLYIFIIYFILKTKTNLPLANNAAPDQMPQLAASDLDLHSLTMSLHWMLGINGLNVFVQIQLNCN